ncbi:MAG: PKD-like domain-containing protein [Bacteroidia bacterium]
MSIKINNILFYKSIKLIITIVLFIVISNTFAQVSITAPSLTLTACNTFPTSPSTLGDIIIAESLPNDIKSSGDLILSTTSNFQFTSAGNIAILGTELNGASISHTGNTTITLSFNVSDTLQLDTIVISGVQVRGIISASTASNIINVGGSAIVTGETFGSVHGTLESTDAPTLTSNLTLLAMCSGETVNYEPTSNVSNTTFNWTRNGYTGLSNPSNNGTNNPNETLVDTSGIPVNVTYQYMLTANGCTNPSTFSVTVTVNPIPTLSNYIATDTICSGTAFSYTPTSNTPNTTFNWTRASVIGISDTANSGTDNPNEILTDTTALPVNATYVYSLSANGCSSSSPYNVVVTVNPTPLLNTIVNDTLCNESTIYIPFTSNTATNYIWFAADNNNTTGESTTNQTTDTILNSITNNTNAIERINYTIIPTATIGGCIGDTTLFFVDIVPTVSVNFIPDHTSCYKNELSVALISNFPSTFSWWAANNNSVDGETTNQVVSDTVNDVLINNDTLMQVVAYSVIPASLTNGCIGDTLTFIAILNGNTRLTSSDSISICSGSQLNAHLTSDAQANFGWAATENLFVLGENIGGQTNDTITDILTNLTDTIQVVNYTVTPYGLNSGCYGTPKNIKIYVQPNLNLITNHILSVCSGTTSNLGANSINNCVYSWSPGTNLNDTTISNPLLSAINNGNTPINRTYYLLVTDSISSCQNTDSVTVTINPQPILNINNPAPVCLPNTINLTDSLITAGSSSGTLSYWTNDVATDTLYSPHIISTNDTNFIKIIAIGGCYAIDSVFTIVNPQVIANAGQDVVICSGTIDSIGSESVNGITYLWSPGIGLSDSTNSQPSILLTNNSSNPDTTNFTLMAINMSTGCQSTDTVSVIINPQPSLQINQPPISCASSPIDITDSLITAGSTTNVLYSYWTDIDATDTLLTPNAIETTDTNYVKIRAMGGCFDIKPIYTSINPTTLVNFTGLNYNNCYNAAPQILTGYPAGGTFSGNGIVGDTFTAAIAGPGSQPVTYTYIDSNGCINSTSQFIQILEPTNLTAEICMVTVNPQSNHNIIYWNKSHYTNNVDSFIVYRETLPDSFQRIASIPYVSPGQYTDTASSIYFPNTGNPNVSANRYKLQIRDTCGVYTPLSKLHQTLYLTNNEGTFSWTPYMIDTSSNPISELSSYVLLRDGNNTGNWDVIASTPASQLTVADPNYTSYPNGRWKLETLWSISCNPSNPINKSTSNIIVETSTIGIKAIATENQSLNIYPNPYSNTTTISYTLTKESEITLEVYDAIGQKVITLINAIQQKGNYAYPFNVKDHGYNSGGYTIRMNVNGLNSIKRIIQTN